MGQDPGWAQWVACVGIFGIFRKQHPGQGGEHRGHGVLAVQVLLLQKRTRGTVPAGAAGTLRGWSFSILPN